VHPVAGFSLYDGFIRPKNRGMTWPECKREWLIVSFVGISSTSPAHSPNRHSNIHSRLSETTDCLGSLSHFRNDFDCWNFLYLKSALNLIATLQMQACCNQERHAKQDSKNSTDYRCAIIVLFRDNQEA
jgi:hypothetical protein